jgi:amino acid adenylation domain-containing protein
MGTKLTRDLLMNRLAELSPDRRRLMQHLLRERKERADTDITIPKRQSSKKVLLSYSQQRLWMLDQIQANSPFYNESFFERFRFRLDVVVLKKALNEIVRRHESLRTVFHVREGEPVQVIAPSLTVSLPVVEIPRIASSQRESEALNLARKEGMLPFDLARGPLLRAALYRLEADDYILLVTIHHIVCDAWSLAIFIWELETLYWTLLLGQPSPLPEPKIQYADFAVWQRSQLEEGLLGLQLSYWEKQLAGLPCLELPTDHHRPPVPTFRGAVLDFRVPDSCVAVLRDLSQLEGGTMFMALLTTFAVLLHRYTGQDDFAVGVPVANRDRIELEGLIGFFVNIIVMRIDCSGNPPFRELLRRVRDTAFAAYSNQHVPFETLVDKLHPERDTSRNPVFQVSCQYLENIETGGPVLAKPENLEAGTAKFDLRLDFHKTDTGLMGYLEYSKDLFASVTAARMVGHLLRVLEDAASNPDSAISDLSILTKEERRQVFVDWNSTAAPYPSSQCVHMLFECHAKKNPESLAICAGGRCVTYGELNRWSNQLAHYLQQQGVGPDEPVAVCLDRSIEMVVAQLAVLKAGGAYLPLDPTYPKNRLELLLARATPRLVLTRARFRNRLGDIATPCWCVDRDMSEVNRLSENELGSEVDADNLAYIIFTSGSTGDPRAVAVEHRSLLNLIMWHVRTYVVSMQDRATQVASPAFDASVWEIWPYLSCGASIHIPDDATIAIPETLLAWLAAEKITISFLPTPLAEMVLELDWPTALRLRVLLTGGDRLRRAPRKSMPFKLVNHYGPTENTVVTTSTWVEVDSCDETAPPIGRPINNVCVYVLDRYGHPVPVGIPGELWVAGAGLARGYLHLPELTAQKFVVKQFEDGMRVRLYRTGDLVRYRRDGNLEFLGRLDQQIKIRGFRVELGEIEAALCGHPAVRECSVVPGENTAGDKQLIAYVVPNLRAKGNGTLPVAEYERYKIEQWRRIYEETYRQPTTDADVTFNVIGWNSSYTGLPIPGEEMREQVDHTVARLCQLASSRVLEIGCGTGLLLFQLARHCECYVGTDFSSTALEYVRSQLITTGLSNVTLLERAADDFTGLASGSFDVVVLNSTVQYFPTADYLLRVLEGAMRVIGPSGHVFVGDVRSLPLLETFHTGIELRRAGPEMMTDDLRERVRYRVRQEQELVVAPEFFVALVQRLPAIHCVDVMLKRGRHHNELANFRYDVVLKVGGEHRKSPPYKILEWGDVKSLEKLRKLLQIGEVECLAVNCVPNSRLFREFHAASLMAKPNAPRTVSELRDLLEEANQGIDPEDVWSLERDLPYNVHVSWPAAGSPDCFDVLFQPKTESGFVNWSRTIGWASSMDAYTNTPMQRELRERLASVLRVHLRERLPHYMTPANFVVLDTIPRTPNGKIDHKALPPSRGRPVTEGSLAAPETVLEKRIAAIWQEVLGLEEVGIHDNFFDVGGHSLLLIRVHSRLREALHIKHSIIDLFAFPTVSSLAKSLAH